MDPEILRRRRAVRFTHAIAAALFASATVIASCATLEDVDTGLCGNRVAEPEAGEDCDGTPTDHAYRCGSRGSEHECRYVWEDEGDCPDGYVASPDQRCRLPSSSYELVSSFPLAGHSPQIADFDGDGAPDVGITERIDPVTSNFNAYTLSGGNATLQLSLPTSSGAAAAELSGDGLADVAIGVSTFAGAKDDTMSTNQTGFGAGGLSVFRSRDGALDLKFYANADFPGDDVRFAALPQWTQPGVTDDNDLALLGALYVEGHTVKVCVIDFDPLCENSTVIADTVASSVDAAVDYSERHVVVSVRVHGEPLLLYLGREGHLGVMPPEVPDLIQLGLEDGAQMVGDARLLDVTGDGLEDLVAIGERNADTGAERGLYVLPGRAAEENAEYFSWSAGEELALWLNLDAEPVFRGPRPGGAPVTLAFAQLNGDGVADFVVGDEVFLSRGVGLSAPEPASSASSVDDYYRRSPWARRGAVAAGDINGDGLDDLIGQSLPFRVQVLLGGELLPLVKLEGDGPLFLSEVRITDFDGDGAGDIVAAFAPTEPTPPPALRSCDTDDELVIAFGRVGGPPEPARSVGFLPAISQISTGRFALTPDGFGDFTVAAACREEEGAAELKTASVLGNPYRLVFNPLTFEAKSGPNGPLSPGAVFAADLISLPDQDGDYLTHPDIIVVGHDLDATVSQAFVLASWGDAELDSELRAELLLPPDWAELGASGYQTYEDEGSDIDIAGSADHLMIATSRLEYDADYNVTGVLGELMIQRAPEDEDDQALEIHTAQLSTSLDYYAGPSFVRAATSELNGDGIPDFVIVYGTILGGGDPTTFETDGMEPTGVGPDSGPGGSETQVTSSAAVLLSSGDGYDEPLVLDGFESFGDAPVDVVLAQGSLVIVGRYDLYAVDAETGAVTAGVFLAEPTLSEAREAVVGDFNGDLLDDILVTDGVTGHLLQQLPANP